MYYDTYIIMGQTKLQITPTGYPYVYLDKSLVVEGLKWKKGERIDVEYDIENKKIICEAGATG